MRICFFGDSFVNGTGDPDHLGWVGRICAEKHRQGHDLTTYNLGIRRDTSAEVRARWRNEANARLPADADGRLIFSFGVNDCIVNAGNHRVSPALTMEHAAAIMTGAAEWKPTLFVGPPPIADGAINRQIGERSESLAALCAGLGIPFLDVFSALQRSDAWPSEVVSGDGAHPGAGGYAHLAQLVTAWPAWQAWF